MLLQSFIVFGDFNKDETLQIQSPDAIAFYTQLDSLKLIEIENRKPKIYPFNPNYITDYKGEQLGMSLKEIDRLLAFRKTNKFVNSKKEFQQVTKVPDSLLVKIAPYFKFPDWVVKRNKTSYKSNFKSGKTKYKKKSISTIDLNQATAEDLKTIYGIGEKLSERIIKYRTKIQGFTYKEQVAEVWGLEKVVVDKVLSTFKIIDKPVIIKQNVNTISFKKLLKNPYIDYNLCKKIFEYRDEVAELQDISELKNIKGFPLDKYNRIVLYLLAE